MEPIEHSGNATFADALRDAINQRGVTLGWLVERLRARGNPVSQATLSYWRTGARRPEGLKSMLAVADIENLLELPSGALAELVGGSRRTGPVSRPVYPLETTRLERAITETFQELEAATLDSLRDVTTHMMTEVGANGRVTSRAFRSVLQSTSGSIAEIPFIEVGASGESERVHASVLHGATLSREYSHPDGEVYGFVFRLAEPLTPAAVALIEWRLDFADDDEGEMITAHGRSRGGRDLLLWTRFHPDAIPAWIEEFEEGTDRTTPVPKKVDASGTVLQTRRTFGPGLLGLRWGY